MQMQQGTAKPVVHYAAAIRKQEAESLASTAAIKAGGVTIQAFAKSQGIAGTTARRKLEEMVNAGTASKRIFEEPEFRARRGGGGAGYVTRKLAVYSIGSFKRVEV